MTQAALEHAQPLSELEAFWAQGMDLFARWNEQADAFLETWGDIRVHIEQDQERRRRSRHPRLHSKGRRSRWPRGV